MIKRIVDAIRSFFNSAESERAQLNRDARVVIDQAQASYAQKSLRDIALLVETELKTSLVHERQNEVSIRYQIDRLRELHRAARRSNDQHALTTYTLVLIYLRSLRHADGTADARERIDGFVRSWKEAEPGEDATLAG